MLYYIGLGVLLPVNLFETPRLQNLPPHFSLEKLKIRGVHRQLPEF